MDKLVQTIRHSALLLAASGVFGLRVAESEDEPSAPPKEPAPHEDNALKYCPVSIPALPPIVRDFSDDCASRNYFCELASKGGSHPLYKPVTGSSDPASGITPVLGRANLNRGYCASSKGNRLLHNLPFPCSSGDIGKITDRCATHFQVSIRVA